MQPVRVIISAIFFVIGALIIVPAFGNGEGPQGVWAFVFYGGSAIVFATAIIVINYLEIPTRIDNWLSASQDAEGERLRRAAGLPPDRSASERALTAKVD